VGLRNSPAWDHSLKSRAWRVQIRAAQSFSSSSQSCISNCIVPWSSTFLTFRMPTSLRVA
jgi:hypothetical protein